VPTGPYRVEGTAPGVEIGSRHVTVPESGVDGVLLAGTRPLTDLAAEVTFTKDTYKPDEAPVVRVTLTNKGNLPLTGIVATCVSGKDLPNLTGTGWGDLTGDGVTVSPHATTTLEVTEPMPSVAPDHGYVRLDCRLSFPGVDSSTNPHVTDEAAVPGRTADLTASIAAYPPASPAGFRMVLTGPDGTCPIFAEGTTDSNGSVVLRRVPVGRHRLYTIPPTPGWWFRLSLPNYYDWEVVSGQTNEATFIAGWSPGGSNTHTQPPNCPGSGGPGGGTPAAQGSATPGLAYTGASLLVPGIAGLLALLAGTGALVVTRRRRTRS